MSWNAIDALDDARWAAQSLLLPFDSGRWLRLAVITFFVAGGGSGAGGGSNVSAPVNPGPGPGPGPITGGELPFGVDPRTAFLAAGVVVVALLLVGLLWAFVGAVMEFVLIEGLRTRDVRVRGPFREFLRQGLGLFLFRAVIVVLLLAAFAVPVVSIVLTANAVPLGVLLLVPLLLAAAFLGLLAAVALRLTTDFAVPAMLAEDRGVVSAWRRLLPLLRAEWKEVGAYLVVRLIAGVAAAIATGLVVTLLAIVVAIPFLLVAAAVFFALGGSIAALGGVGAALLVVVGLLFLLSVLAVGAVVQVPVVAYFRYYALFFLGATDERLDLVANLRGLGGADADPTNDDGDGPGAAV